MKYYLLFSLLLLFLDSGFAKKLDAYHLEQLVRQNQTLSVLKASYDDQSTLGKCYSEWAQQRLGLKKKTFVEALWLVPHSQPKGCDHLFSLWFEHDLISQKAIFERYLLALSHDDLHLANYLYDLLEKKQHAKQAKAIYFNPKLIHELPTINPKISVLAIERIAEKYSATKAEKVYLTLKAKNAIPKHIADHINEVLSTYYALEHHPRTEYYFHQIKKKPNNQTITWQIRYQLKESHWIKVIKLIRALEKKSYRSTQWQYWLAHSLKAIGQKSLAMKIFNKIHTERDLYGIFASIKLNQSVSFQHAIPEIKKNDSIVKELSPIKKLIDKNSIHAARLAWDEKIKHMSANDRLNAAVLALKWQRPDLTIRTANTLANAHYLSLRFPTFYQSSVEACEKQFGFPKALVYAMIRQESAFQVDAKSNEGAHGLLQLMPSTARYIANKKGIILKSQKDLLNPHFNIKLGCHYLDYLMKKFDNNLIAALAAYNMGPNNVLKRKPLPTENMLIWIENLPRKETRHYLKNILTYMVIYEYLSGKLSRQSLRALQ